MLKLFQRLQVAPENGKRINAIFFAFFTSGIMSVMLGSLLPYIQDDNLLSYSQSGLILSAHQLGNLLAVLAAGFLPYLIGLKKSTMTMGAGTALGLGLMAFASGMWPLFIAFALTGVGRGTMSNVCNAVVSEAAGNKSGALNLLHAVFATGALLSPLIVYLWTSSAASGWPYAALTALALAAASMILLERAGLSNVPMKKNAQSWAFLKDARLWLDTMILFFYLCVEASIIGWFVAYFRDAGVLPPQVAGFTPALLWLMMMIGRLALASISARADKAKLLLALSAGVTLFFAGMLLSRSAALCVVSLLGFGLMMGGIYPTTFSTIRGTASTAATGFVIATATLGGILMPSIVGAVADIYGLTGGITTIFAALAGMTALIIIKLILSNKGKRERG